MNGSWNSLPTSTANATFAWRRSVGRRRDWRFLWLRHRTIWEPIQHNTLVHPHPEVQIRLGDDGYVETSGRGR